jgi:hypothetical protein
MKKILTIVSAMLFLVFFSLSPQGAIAQKSSKKNKGNSSATAEKSDKKDNGFKKPSELLKNTVSEDGLFTLHRDSINGSSYLEIREDQLDRLYIYFSFIEDGVMDAGFFRGAYRGSKVISFHRHYDRIEIIHHNNRYYFDPENPLSKAAKANVNTPILASEKIEALDKENGKLYISGDKIFLSENFQMVKPPSRGTTTGFLGSLNKEKTKIKRIKNYPENTDVSVTYVYYNAAPKNGGSSAVTDARSVAIGYQHSIIEMPDNNYKPRKDDARIGYFSTQVDDMTSFDATPWRDVIHRWHLEKKDPNAAVSEPVEPITWWIENTTPYEFRDIIKDGVERWNMAFEKAGFKNAIVVKVQPDDAEWDAGDIRYNVLRWTSSPQPPFGGYGPSFVNPLTGQILGADIMLEFAAIKGRLFREEVFTEAGLSDHSVKLTKEEMIADMHRCDAGEVMHRNMLFGMHAMRALNMGDAANKEFVQQTLHRLVLHEVGHTLGLSHNMRASTMLSFEEIHQPDLVLERGLCNSVMEYPAINFPYQPEHRSLFFDPNPGPYDYWVIEYGYSSALNDDMEEDKRLETILSRSNRHELAFGNDADDMRAPGKAINPEVNIYDLTSDPVAYAAERCDLVRKIMPTLQERYLKQGENYHELRNAFLVLTAEYATQIGVMSKWVGGVRFDRSVHGEENPNRPFEPIEKNRQKEAMEALNKYAFSPGAFDVTDDVYNYLQMQRRGFGFFGAGEDPRVLGRIKGAYAGALTHLLHPTTLQRITDSEFYGNDYPLAEVMTDLTDAIFKADLRSTVSAHRQDVQLMYVNKLATILDPKLRYHNQAKSMALHELKRIKSMMASSAKADVLTKAHRDHIVMIVDQALQPKT